MHLKLTKAEIARRQLGTALSLFLDGLDPVSVHVLTCSGHTIAQQLAISAGGFIFRDYVTKANGIDDKEHRRLFNRFNNAFKHFNDLGHEKPRDDDELLASFDPAENIIRLFTAWAEYNFSGHKLPVEAKIFTQWFLATQRHKFAKDVDPDFIARTEAAFPNACNLALDEQLHQLREGIKKYRNHPGLLDSRDTDLLPLIIPIQKKN